MDSKKVASQKKALRNLGNLDYETKSLQIVVMKAIQDYDWRAHIDATLYEDLRRKQTLKQHFSKGIEEENLDFYYENALLLFTWIKMTLFFSLFFYFFICGSASLFFGFFISTHFLLLCFFLLFFQKNFFWALLSTYIRCETDSFSCFTFVTYYLGLFFYSWFFFLIFHSWKK